MPDPDAWNTTWLNPSLAGQFAVCDTFELPGLTVVGVVGVTGFVVVGVGVVGRVVTGVVGRVVGAGPGSVGVGTVTGTVVLVVLVLVVVVLVLVLVVLVLVVLLVLVSGTSVVAAGDEVEVLSPAGGRVENTAQAVTAAATITATDAAGTARWKNHHRHQSRRL